MTTPLDWDHLPYYKSHQYENVKKFMVWADKQPLEFYYPNWEKAPWHVQCVVSDHYDILVDFYPHKEKVLVEGGTVEQGFGFYDMAINEAAGLASDELDSAERA